MMLIETEFPEFTKEELLNFRENFMKYDENNSGELEIFELNVMFQHWGFFFLFNKLYKIFFDTNKFIKGNLERIYNFVN